MDTHVSVNAPDSITDASSSTDRGGGGGGGGALKEKLRSFNTLTTLYHESRQEMELLHKQVLMKDNIIADLRARLGRYERIYLTAGGAADAADAAAAGAVVVGPSKSLLESLCREICKLKAERSDEERGAARQREEIQRLTSQLREKDLELESVRHQPDHHKDLEIRRLRSALEERERSEATRAVLCSSLAEEADQLRGQLGATVKVCQELLARLETEKTRGDGEAAETESKSADASDQGAVSAKLVRLQEENKQLRQRVTYVQGLNSQWQKYDSSREDYIRGLCQRLKESSAAAAAPGLMVPGLGSVGAGLLHQEIARLNGLLEEKMSEGARLSREAKETRRKDQDRIQTLEQQVLIYADDFKSERRDRERAQGQIQDLREQVYQLKQQLHKQGAAKESRDVVPMCRVHIGHRISTRRHKDNIEHLLRSSAETQKQPAANPPPAPAAVAMTTPNPAWSDCLSELQCPRCQARFSDADTVEYLKHWEDCAKL